MEYKLSPDKRKETPPVPIKTYQWEDVRKAREVGAYPWTHLLKPPLEGEITAEDIIRETTPRRSMSREFSKSRTHSPVDKDSQKILDLDSSPGSSRRHGEGGEDEGVHVPKFSKEVSLESEEDTFNQAVNTYLIGPDSQASSQLSPPIEAPKNVSPKGILKRRIPDQYIGVTETREKTKCCHPLVNKIKHLADKTLHKLERSENEKSPQLKKKKNEDGVQEIRQLKSSPSAVKRQKFSAIKLGDSDEMSKSMSTETPPPRKKKEHIYEDIEENKGEKEKSLHFSAEVGIEDENKSLSNRDSENYLEKKSNASQDPSLISEDGISLKPEEHIMEILHKPDDTNKDANLLDEEMDPDEPNVDEIFQNQLDETRPKSESPNITITEIEDESNENIAEHSNAIPIESSPSPSPSPLVRNEANEYKEWSKPSSDHEYEIIEKPSANILYDGNSVQDDIKKTDDELSSTTSVERKYLQHTSDEEEPIEYKENIHEDKNQDYLAAEQLQKNIEDRFFVNTPSTVSRTECEISTSQVDSSALENLPLKRDSRPKNGESLDSKIQQRLKEGTGKLKNQADKLKTKLQNIKTKQFTMPDKAKFYLPDRPKFKMPERPKISLPERPKFHLPDRRKFSLPDRPKFKKINISDKFSLGDRKKFTFPDRPKFNVPDLPKFKMPDTSIINFPSLGRKKEYKVETKSTEANAKSNRASEEFESTTFPRLFGRKKKPEIPKTSSSPTLSREDTPPPTFTFTRVNKVKPENTSFPSLSPEEPREYGSINNEPRYDNETRETKNYDTTYDFDKLDLEYTAHDEDEVLNFNKSQSLSSVPQISASNPKYSHVINEIDNDEFFVRPKGISRENIQVREYLSDEIRQAFKIPKNALAMMGSQPGVDDNHMDVNEAEADPELMMDDNMDENISIGYSHEDINERDDGYYTFPPVRPSRAKRKKNVVEPEPVPYIDESIHASMQFSDIDLGMQEQDRNEEVKDMTSDLDIQHGFDDEHRYANDTEDYPQSIPIQSQTLPMPPKRRRKFGKKEPKYSSLHDLKSSPQPQTWVEPSEPKDDIIVYRTEHEYIVPPLETYTTDQSPIPPTRTRSPSSRATSLCDDDRTSQGAESLTLDTHMPQTEDIEIEREIRHESPGYATVDKSHAPPPRRSRSKTPPARRRKSNSSERKYYTVSHTKPIPDRPPRKKSSTSLITLESLMRRSVSADFTQYVEIDETRKEDIQKDLKSGKVLSKMKDRPLPPPPRPPRGSRRKKNRDENVLQDQINNITEFSSDVIDQQTQHKENLEVIEIEVSTQTDPLPDDVDFELGLEENIDLSISSSLKDIIDEEPMLNRSISRQIDSPRFSRPNSRSEKSIKLSDPKISELSKSHVLGRTSPTVILVERRVSSPTKINEHDEILTEASLTVQHIDVDESKVPDVPPLPQSRRTSGAVKGSKSNISHSTDDRALDIITDASRDIQLDNLITQRLQVRDLDVGRLNVSELQASKILVSDIEGMTLQVTELDSKSGHISVSGIEFSQSIIDEIVKKFTEISTNNASEPMVQTNASTEIPPRPVSREEETQTDQPVSEETKATSSVSEQAASSSKTLLAEEPNTPPQRPPPPDLTPLLYSYLQDITAPSSSLYHTRVLRERPFTEFYEAQHQSPPPPTRRVKRKPAATRHSGSSSCDEMSRPSPRRMPPPVKTHEPTVTEAGAQFLRVCHNSINRVIRNMFNSFMSYISGTEDKKDVQMALVIFLVLIAGLIMFGLSDNRTIHHHHWEFFNPPDGEK